MCAVRVSPEGGIHMADPYAEPRTAGRIEDCYFYHTMDIPGHGSVEGEWDLRPNIDAYLGGLDLSGKRLLDVGAANGIMTFHAEGKGAEVVSFDLSEHHSWDVVPYRNSRIEAVDAERRGHMRRINNGYWFAHAAHRSLAQAVYGDVYNIPASIGDVDAAFYGSILLHLRDPFLALQNGARLATSMLIVSDICPYGELGPRIARFLKHPVFIPDPVSMEPWDTWWNLPPRLIEKYMKILGFPDTTVTWHRQIYRGAPRTLYTVVGRR
jgi:hypothetical protein